MQLGGHVDGQAHWGTLIGCACVWGLANALCAMLLASWHRSRHVLANASHKQRP